MTVTVVNGYTNVPDLAAYMGGQIDSTAYNDRLAYAINAASRAIDGYCGRRFYLDGAATARVYWTHDTRAVRIDDCTTISTVKVSSLDNGTYDTTYASTAYAAEPLNGRSDGLEGLPIMRLRFSDDVLPLDTDTPCLQVTATWGWAAVPEPIRQASLIMASEVFKLAEAPFGVAGANEWGVVRVGKMSPQAADMLRPYRLGGAAFGFA